MHTFTCSEIGRDRKSRIVVVKPQILDLPNVVVGDCNAASTYARFGEWGVTSLAVPPLGCGNGQLEWRVVGPTLHRHLAELPIPVELYAPHGTPQEELQLNFFGNAKAGSAPSPNEPQQWVTPGLIALVETVARITNLRYHWPIGRTRFQKIAYFLSTLGVPTGLHFARGSYGPYAEGLKHSEAKLINNGLLTERHQGKMLLMSPGPTYEDARKAYESELASWDEAIEQVVDLFARLPTDDTEIAASVHLVVGELTTQLDRTPTENEVFEEVLRWKAKRRPPLDAQAVRMAIESLAVLGWINVEPSDDALSEVDRLLLAGA